MLQLSAIKTHNDFEITDGMKSTLMAGKELIFKAVKFVIILMGLKDV